MTLKTSYPTNAALTLMGADKTNLVRCYISGKPVRPYARYNRGLWQVVDGLLYPIYPMDPYVNAHLFNALVTMLRDRFPRTWADMELDKVRMQAVFGDLL